MSQQILISHSSKDSQAAQQIKRVLEENGFSCWLDSDNIPAGSNYYKEIADALRECDVVVVLVSPNSQNSEWVMQETTEAFNREKLVIPYVMQDFKIRDEFNLCLRQAQRVYAYDGQEEEALRRVIISIANRLGNSVGEDDEIRITIEKNPKKKHLLYAAIGMLGIALAAAVILLLGRGNSNQIKKAAVPQVYYSKLLPYNEAGYYSTYDDNISAQESHTYSVSKAFSILSFLRAEEGSSAFVEQISCEITELNEIDTPVPKADAFIQNNRIRLFAYNNGWGDGNMEYTVSLEPYNDYTVLESVSTMLPQNGSVSVKEAGVALIGETELDTAEIRTFSKEHNLSFTYRVNTLNIYLSCGDRKYQYKGYLLYDPGTDTFSLDYDGIGDGGDYSITLYALLDVDSHPTSIQFTGEQASPYVQDAFRIETVIIPTKSCDITCKDVYSIGGEQQETEEYSVSVSVPVFLEGSCERSGIISRDLMNVDLRDEITVNRILESYRYNPRIILDYSK